MEETKENLRHDFNLAVRSFNERDYTSFFRNIRPAIELLSKVLILDFIKDEETAWDVIDGNLSFYKTSMNGYELQEGDEGYRRKPKPTGKTFPLLISKAYLYKHNDMCDTTDPAKSRIKRGLESCSSELARYYDIASGLGNHTDRNLMTPSVQATACVTFLLGYIDFLNSNGILSNATNAFIQKLDQFDITGDDAAKEQQQEIDGLIRQLELKDAAFIKAQELQLEAEKKQLEAENSNTVMKEKMDEMQRMIDDLKSQLDAINVSEIAAEEDKEEEIPEANELSAQKPKLKLADILKTSTSTSWDVSEDSMDDDQLDLIEMNINKSMLVTGCAGSGKSVIAMHKAEQIAKLGKKVILIAYTKSLSAFMREGIDQKSLPYSFYHHYQWKNKFHMPKADYIIVDEIQDFTREEVLEFIAAANTAYFFFGDSAQSIYKSYGKDTISIEEISKLTGLKPLQLYNNYRLPRPIAKITQSYVGVNVNPYEDRIYQNKEKSLPHFVKFSTEEDQMSAICSLVEKYTRNLFDNQTIGILLPSNELVIKTCMKFKASDIPCEFKYNIDDNNYVDTLDFGTFLPKILTYHSAKGLQFDVVILPMYIGANDDESKKALYVAMTRTMHQLYILYSSPELNAPLAKVPQSWYLKTL